MARSFSTNGLVSSPSVSFQRLTRLGRPASVRRSTSQMGRKNTQIHSHEGILKTTKDKRICIRSRVRAVFAGYISLKACLASPS
ncbi:hypothetical protein EYR41_007708 [Orbilia oligospora]|uniref:Uncharacterized protein n=1 Tax=Orbilia oligospora TaxID=2813651 RepID=A0A8H2HNX5_ORBOL|nr:hypothetical protein EYR41_007708 [Orbilia oligospora]